jgi:hypothetical protein
MARDKHELSKRKGGVIDQEHIDANSWRFKERSRHANRIRDAIDGQNDLSHMICDDGLCRSIFCMTCRERRQNSLHDQFSDRITRFLDDQDAKDNLRYVTILHQLVPVSLDGVMPQFASIDEVNRSVDDFKRMLKSVDRKLKANDLWARGSIHLELINMDCFNTAYTLGKVSKKERTLKEFEQANSVNSTMYILGSGLID